MAVPRSNAAPLDRRALRVLICVARNPRVDLNNRRRRRVVWRRRRNSRECEEQARSSLEEKGEATKTIVKKRTYRRGSKPTARKVKRRFPHPVNRACARRPAEVSREMPATNERQRAAPARRRRTGRPRRSGCARPRSDRQALFKGAIASPLSERRQNDVVDDAIVERIGGGGERSRLEPASSAREAQNREIAGAAAKTGDQRHLLYVSTPRAPVALLEP